MHYSSATAAQHNGGFVERLIPPSAGRKPHILWLVIDDYGWAELSVHRNPPSPEVVTPNMEGLIHEGILFDRHYVYKYCSPVSHRPELLNNCVQCVVGCLAF